MITLYESKLNRYLPYFLGTIIVIILSIGIWFGYDFYQGKINQKAQTDLFELVEAYLKAVKKADKNQIDDAEQAFKVSAQRHKNSNFYPYFLAYQADALIWQNKLKDGVTVLEEAVKALGKIDQNQPLYYLYSTKLAQVKLDVPEFKMEGSEELEKLSKLAQNPYKI